MVRTSREIDPSSDGLPAPGHEGGPLVRLTERMLRAAEAGRWIELAELEGLRQEWLAEHGQALEALGVEERSGLLAELNGLNERIAGLVVEAREGALGRLQNLNRGRRAKQAYATHSD